MSFLLVGGGGVHVVMGLAVEYDPVGVRGVELEGVGEPEGIRALEEPDAPGVDEPAEANVVEVVALPVIVLFVLLLLVVFVVLTLVVLMLVVGGAGGLGDFPTPTQYE